MAQLRQVPALRGLIASQFTTLAYLVTPRRPRRPPLHPQSGGAPPAAEALVGSLQGVLAFVIAGSAQLVAVPSPGPVEGSLFQHGQRDERGGLCGGDRHATERRERRPRAFCAASRSADVRRRRGLGAGEPLAGLQLRCAPSRRWSCSRCPSRTCATSSRSSSSASHASRERRPRGSRASSSEPGARAPTAHVRARAPARPSGISNRRPSRSGRRPSSTWTRVASTPRSPPGGSTRQDSAAHLPGRPHHAGRNGHHHDRRAATVQGAAARAARAAGGSGGGSGGGAGGGGAAGGGVGWGGAGWGAAACVAAAPASVVAEAEVAPVRVEEASAAHLAAPASAPVRPAAAAPAAARVQAAEVPTTGRPISRRCRRRAPPAAVGTRSRPTSARAGGRARRHGGPAGGPGASARRARRAAAPSTAQPALRGPAGRRAAGPSSRPSSAPAKHAAERAAAAAAAAEEEGRMLALKEQAAAAPALDGHDPYDPRRERLYGGAPPGSTCRRRARARASPPRQPRTPPRRLRRGTPRDGPRRGRLGCGGSCCGGHEGPSRREADHRAAACPAAGTRGSDRHVQRVQSARRGRLAPRAPGEDDGLREVPWAERGGPLGGLSAHPPPGHAPTAAAGGAPACMPVLACHDGLADEVIQLSADGLAAYARTEAEAAGAVGAGAAAQDSSGHWYSPHAACGRAPAAGALRPAGRLVRGRLVRRGRARGRTRGREPSAAPAAAPRQRAQRGRRARRKPKPSVWGPAGTIDSGRIAAAIYGASLRRAQRAVGLPQTGGSPYVFNSATPQDPVIKIGLSWTDV